MASGGTAPLFYSIDNGLTIQSPGVFNHLISGRYLVLIKDANDCKARDTVQLTALPTPSVFLGNDTVFSIGMAIMLNAPQQPGYTYLWQDNSVGRHQAN